MGRAYDFVVAAVLVIISAVIHLVAVELFAPGNALYQIATDGTSTLNGTARANLWFEFLTVWMPLMVIGTAFVWVTIREYRRQVQTATQTRR